MKVMSKMAIRFVSASVVVVLAGVTLFLLVEELFGSLLTSIFTLDSGVIVCSIIF